MIRLVVYADILIILNIVVDYFLLLAAAVILKIKTSVKRVILAAIIGGISSLYIFAPDFGVVIEIVFKLVSAILMVLCSYKFKGVKHFLRSVGVFFVITCAYCGIMTAVWNIFKPRGMTVINSVVYFNISPLVLIISSLAVYLIFRILTLIFTGNNDLAEKCNIKLTYAGKSCEVEGLVDSGNSITDVFGEGEVIIADESVLKKLFGEIQDLPERELKSRYRVIPCNTVSGNGLLEGYRCDFATIISGKKQIALKRPIIAVSKVPIRDNYKAIINPKIFVS